MAGTVAKVTSAPPVRLTRAGASLAASAVAGMPGLAAGGQALAGYGQGPVPLTPQQIARMLRHGGAKLDNPQVRAYVLGLEGCLTELPPRLRTVLRLRAGVAERRPLSARAVARRLHVSRKRLAVLEVRAMRLLSNAARTTGCATRTQAASLATLAPVSFTIASGGEGAGGVAGGLYFKAPAETGAETVPPGEAIPSPTLRVAQSSDAPLIWALVAALAGVLLVAYLVRSDMGLGTLPAGLRRRRRGGRSNGRGRDKPPRG